MNKILYGVLSWWEIIQTCPISRQELLMKFSLNLFFHLVFRRFHQTTNSCKWNLKKMIPTLFIFFVKGVLADILLVLFLEKKKPIFEDWMHQTTWVMNGIQRSCTSCYYIWFRKKQYLGMSRFLSHYYNSTWQLLTDSDRNESISQKKENYCFSGNIPHICHESHEYTRVNFFWLV